MEPGLVRAPEGHLAPVDFRQQLAALGAAEDVGLEGVAAEDRALEEVPPRRGFPVGPHESVQDIK